MEQQAASARAPHVLFEGAVARQEEIAPAALFLAADAAAMVTGASWDATGCDAAHNLG